MVICAVLRTLFYAETWAFSTLQLAPPWREPLEAPLESGAPPQGRAQCHIWHPCACVLCSRDPAPSGRAIGAPLVTVLVPRKPRSLAPFPKNLFEAFFFCLKNYLLFSEVIFRDPVKIPFKISMKITSQGYFYISASAKVSHKRVFTLIRWQPGTANTRFCSIWVIF